MHIIARCIYFALTVLMTFNATFAQDIGKPFWDEPKKPPSIAKGKPSKQAPVAKIDPSKLSPDMLNMLALLNETGIAKSIGTLREQILLNERQHEGKLKSYGLTADFFKPAIDRAYHADTLLLALATRMSAMLSPEDVNKLIEFNRLPEIRESNGLVQSIFADPASLKRYFDYVRSKKLPDTEWDKPMYRELDDATGTSKRLVSLRAALHSAVLNGYKNSGLLNVAEYAAAKKEFEDQQRQFQIDTRQLSLRTYAYCAKLNPNYPFEKSLDFAKSELGQKFYNAYFTSNQAVAARAAEQYARESVKLVKAREAKRQSVWSFW